MVEGTGVAKWVVREAGGKRVMGLRGRSHGCCDRGMGDVVPQVCPPEGVPNRKLE